MGKFIKFLVIALTLLHFSASHANEPTIRVRDAGGKCGLYIRGLAGPKINRFKSVLRPEAINEYLSSEEFREWVRKNEANTRKEYKISLVGVDPAQEAGLRDQILAQLRSLDLPEIQVEALKRGIYVSELGSPSRGQWVADLDGLQEFLDTKPDLEGRMIYGVGLSLLGKDRSEFKNTSKSAIKEAGYTNIRVRPITTPKNIIESAIMSFPLPEDWQKPTVGELVPATLLYSISNSTFVAITLLTQPAEIAIPVSVVSALQSASTTFPRQFWGNYFTRSRNFPEKLAKQFGMSMVFTMGIYLAKIGGGDGIGAVGATLISLPAFWQFFSEKFWSMSFQTAWRIPVESGIPEWVAGKTRSENEKRARKFGTWYRQIATNIATPAWGYSTITNDSLGYFLFNWTWGHIIMGGVGGFFALANRVPEIYEFPLKVASQPEQKPELPPMQMQSRF